MSLPVINEIQIERDSVYFTVSGTKANGGRKLWRSGLMTGIGNQYIAGASHDMMANHDKSKSFAHSFRTTPAEFQHAFAGVLFAAPKYPWNVRPVCTDADAETFDVLWSFDSEADFHRVGQLRWDIARSRKFQEMGLDL